jgi:hypothetical protein
MFGKLLGAKSVKPWSKRVGYKGGHRSGIPKRGSQHRKFTTRGGLFGSTGRSLFVWKR